VIIQAEYSLIEIKNDFDQTPKEVAEKCGFLGEFCLILEANEKGELEEFDPNFMSDFKTLVITDDRYLDHVGFDNYSNVKKREIHK